MSRKKIGLLSFALFAFHFADAQLYINYDFNTFYRTSGKIQNYIQKATGGAFGTGYVYKNYYAGFTAGRYEYRTDLRKVMAMYPKASFYPYINFEDEAFSANFGYLFPLKNDFKILTRLGFGRYNLYISDYNYTEDMQEFEVTYDLYRGHIYSFRTNLMYQPHPNFGFSFSLLLSHTGAKGAYYLNNTRYKDTYNGNTISCTLGFYFQFFNKRDNNAKVEDERF